jgi:acyl carrier protein
MSGTNSIGAQIQAFVLKQFPLARKRPFDDQVGLLESGILDSMGTLEMVGYLERQFAITIQDEELLPENFQTVRSMAEFVGRKQAEIAAGTQR